MAFDPEFIPNETVSLPALSDSVASRAYDGGRPVDHLRFSLVFNIVRGFAVYTAHNVDGATVIPMGQISRRDSFDIDPKVPAELQVDNHRGYRGRDNPWDRGHMVRRRSLHWGNEDEARMADKESFYWTNIAPQHENLHSSAWGKIENWMFDRADADDQKACVFTGPVFTPYDPWITNKPGEDPIQIPAGFWKIFVIHIDGHLRAAAFLVWQRDHDRPRPVSFDPVVEQVRLTTLEYLTGLSFESIREADPLHYGPIPSARARAAMAGIAPAVPRPVAVTGAQDIVL